MKKWAWPCVPGHARFWLAQYGAGWLSKTASLMNETYENLRYKLFAETHCFSLMRHPVAPPTVHPQSRRQYNRLWNHADFKHLLPRRRTEKVCWAMALVGRPLKHLTHLSEFGKQYKLWHGPRLLEILGEDSCGFQRTCHYNKLGSFTQKAFWPLTGEAATTLTDAWLRAWLFGSYKCWP